MADDRTQPQNPSRDSQSAGSGNDRLDDLARKHGGLHPGMTSPDSTEVPLRADTGEPDEEAISGRGAEDDDR